MFEHYVVFKPKQGCTDELSQALAELGDGVQNNLPCLLELTFGENINPSGLDRGFTHGCFARLTSREAFKEEYWNHPAHIKLLAVLDELCDERFALDYLVEDAVTGRKETTT